LFICSAGIEPMTLYKLGKCFTIERQSPALFYSNLKVLKRLTRCYRINKQRTHMHLVERVTQLKEVLSVEARKTAFKKISISHVNASSFQK
jgi:hypothetical protein